MLQLYVCALMYSYHSTHVLLHDLGALQHVGRVIPISEENLQDNKRAYQIRIDTKGSGIQLEPGSHVGVLYESSADSIWTTLLAFADGDKIKAKVRVPCSNVSVPAPLAVFLFLTNQLILNYFHSPGSWKELHG